MLSVQGRCTRTTKSSDRNFYLIENFWTHENGNVRYVPSSKAEDNPCIWYRSPTKREKRKEKLVWPFYRRTHSHETSKQTFICEWFSFYLFFWRKQVKIYYSLLVIYVAIAMPWHFFEKFCSLYSSVTRKLAQKQPQSHALHFHLLRI